jgi:hypothetical protein
VTKLLAPSDLSYLYDRCPRCYWLKLRGIVGPSDTLPAVFRDIDKAQKLGITLETIQGLGIEATEFIPREKVVSLPADFGGSSLAISGFTDRRVRMKDGTVGVLDYKTSAPRIDKLARFWRAMSAYQYAIEHTEQPEPVTLLSLIVFTPSGFSLRKGSAVQAFYKGDLRRVDIDIDRPKFVRMLEAIGKLLASDDMPTAGSCDTCRHVDAVVGMRMNGLLHAIATHDELGPDMAASIAAKVKL